MDGSYNILSEIENDTKDNVAIEIEAICQRYFEKENFSGVVLVKRENNILFTESYGFAHRGFEIKNSLDTMFDTASITKLFTTVAILQLVDKKLLSLEDKIVDIIDLTGTEIPWDVTIFHLLTHTSGIADDADEEAGEKYEDLFISKPNYSIRNCSDFIPQFAYKKPNFKAGTNVRYNNCAFVLLGLAIEKLTNKSYREYVSENIFKVCGMRNTRFSSRDDGDEKIAEGYYSVVNKDSNTISWKKNIYSYPPIGTADGGAFTTAYDLDVFMRQLKAGKLLSYKLTSEIMKSQVNIEKNCDGGKIINGYGFHFKYDKRENLVSMFKEGANAGVAAMFAYYPSIDTTSIVLANQTCNVWKLHGEVEEILLNMKV
ncbi:serine hydrolase domain-containing protein [Clostridium manihotivorum]|uniref:Serine hydrolase n=1 Tax=Clostridium manihotivorum TaxID=2320868 RepID=A0A3R5QYG7_9CLOT|nr:serine hydrolase domain-containing protein [Clostridium manihotivorum]QAA32488.1 serine hydrolase [Clostridium manihotivorum]